MLGTHVNLGSDSSIPIVGLRTIFSFFCLAHKFLVLLGFAQGIIGVFLSVNVGTFLLDSRTSGKSSHHLVNYSALVVIAVDSTILHSKAKRFLDLGLKLLSFFLFRTILCHWFYLFGLSAHLFR